MFILTDMLRNVSRNKGKSLISLIIIFILSCFILIYSGFLAKQNDELSALSDNANLELTICNIAGTQTTGLCIETSKLDKIAESGYVEPDYYVTKVLYTDVLLTTGKLRGGMEGGLKTGCGITNSMNLSDEISFLDGYNLSFFEGNEYYLVMKKSVMDDLGLNLGDEFTREFYNVADRTNSSASYYVGNHSFKIIGTYNSINISEIPTNCTFLCPFNTLREMAEEKRYHTWPTSAKFKLVSPEYINNLTALLADIKIGQVQRKTNSNAKYGDTAIISDGVFIRTSEPIMKNVKLLKSLYYPIFAVSVLIGFLASFLLMQSRKTEIAIRLSLGVAKSNIFCEMLLENMSLAVISSAFALVLVGLFTGLRTTAIFALLVLLVMYLVGSSIAVLSLLRTNVLQVLTSE